MSLSLGDAIVTSLHDAKGFSKEDFKLYHPRGKIGTNIFKVTDIMRSGGKLPIVGINDEFKSVILTMTKKCLGYAIVGDSQNQMRDIFSKHHLWTRLQFVVLITFLELPWCCCIL